MQNSMDEERQKSQAAFAAAMEEERTKCQVRNSVRF